MRSYGVVVFAEATNGIQAVGGFDDGSFSHRVELHCEVCGSTVKDVLFSMDDKVMYKGKAYHALAKCSGCGRAGTIKIVVGAHEEEMFYSIRDLTRRQGVEVLKMQCNGLQAKMETYTVDGIMRVLLEEGGKKELRIEEDMVCGAVSLRGVRFSLTLLK